MSTNHNGMPQALTTSPAATAAATGNSTNESEENRVFLDGAAGAGRAWGSLEQRGLH